MTKIKPEPSAEGGEFDGLDELHNVEYHLSRGGQSKRRVKKKRTTRANGGVAQGDVTEVVKSLLIGKRSLQIGAPFTVIGVFVFMLLQLHPMSQRYNGVIICALSAAIEFKYFTTQSVRAQLTIALIVLLSIAADLFQLIVGRNGGLRIAAASLQVVLKLCLLNAFLRNSQGAVRTRKYLYRRFRLFIIPLHQPKRVMRDVRGRIAAIWWMHAVAVVCFGLLLILYFVFLDFTSLYLGTASSASIPTFLMFKTASSLLVFVVILLDLDVRLCLWHFGCLGCSVEYVRKYISRKRIELKGFPLIFAFSKYRFQVIQGLKVLDFLWGLYGWAILSSTFGTKFYSIGLRLQVFCGVLAFCLVVFDVWVATLFLGVRWLLHRDRLVREISRETGTEALSDDSEIEEFGLRASLEERQERDEDKVALAEMRRRLYFRRMKEEETRLAASTAQRDSRGRPGLAGASDWLKGAIQQWRPQQSSSAVAPLDIREGDPMVGEAGGAARAGWELEGAEEHDVTHSHPAMKQLQTHAELYNVAHSSDKYASLLELLGSNSRDRVEAKKATKGNTNREGAGKQQAVTRGMGGGGVRQRIHPDDRASTAEEGREQDQQETMSPLARRGGLHAESSGSSAAVALDPSFAVPAEEFAGLWELLVKHNSSTTSTVRVAAQLQMSALPMRPAAAKEGDNTETRLLQQRQQVLAAVVKHLRTLGFGVSSAGLHERRDIQIYFSAKQAGAGDTSNAAKTIALLEVKLYPGTVVDRGRADDVQQVSYLLECNCRCTDERLRRLYISTLRLEDLFTFVD
jgi:hypothetical protein